VEINLKEFTLWSSRLLWPALVIALLWAFNADLGPLFEIVALLLVVASVLVGWWQKRIYLAAMAMLLIGLSDLFSYMQNIASSSFSIMAVYLVLIFFLTIACFASFGTYLLKVQKPMIMAYLVSVVFICVELFWLLSNMAADPIIKAVLVTGLFHIVFSMVALYSWGKLAKLNYRWYLIGTVLFFAIFIRLL
jgi:hypothetical protein